MDKQSCLLVAIIGGPGTRSKGRKVVATVLLYVRYATWFNQKNVFVYDLAQQFVRVYTHVRGTNVHFGASQIRRGCDVEMVDRP